MAARDDVQRLAAALERPRGGYRDGLEITRRAVAARSPEAARQLEVFVDRIADLTIDELCELHDETFGHDGAGGTSHVVRRLAQRPCDVGEARAALDQLALALDRLDADRNPFAYVVRALCCALFARAAPLRRDATTGA